MNAEQNSKLSAFPFVETNETSCVSNGLSKREYFAGLAMQGLLSAENVNDFDSQILTKASVRIADELLKQLSE